MTLLNLRTEQSILQLRHHVDHGDIFQRSRLPATMADINGDRVARRLATLYKSHGRAVLVMRNPLDAILSW